MPHLKNLITNYQTKSCEKSFEELYATVYEALTNYARKLARQLRLNWEDVESETNFVILKAVETYDVKIGEFEPYLFKMLKGRILHMVESSTRYSKYVNRYLEDAATSTGNEPEIAAIKKEQRELLRCLTANADDKSRQALTAFASAKTFREAGKLIGVNHETVKSRIRKISAGSQHISLNEYITA